tara:strand:+ start:49 stop:897 length:849 start_codon:yes stop_codon:yes gene_type:complete
MKKIVFHFAIIFIISLAFSLAPDGFNGGTHTPSMFILVAFTGAISCSVLTFYYRYSKIHTLREGLLAQYAKEGHFPPRKHHLITIMTGVFFIFLLSFILIISRAIDAASATLPTAYSIVFIVFTVLSCFTVFNNFTHIFEICDKKPYFRLTIGLMLYFYLIISMFTIGFEANLTGIFIAFFANFLVKCIIYAPYYRHALVAKFKIFLPKTKHISGRGFLALIFSNDIKSLDKIIKNNIALDTPEAKAYLQHCIESGSYGWSDLLQRLHPSQKPVCLELMSRT